MALASNIIFRCAAAVLLATSAAASEAGDAIRAWLIETKADGCPTEVTAPVLGDACRIVSVSKSGIYLRSAKQEMDCPWKLIDDDALCTMTTRLVDPAPIAVQEAWLRLALSAKKSNNDDFNRLRLALNAKNADAGKRIDAAIQAIQPAAIATVQTEKTSVVKPNNDNQQDETAYYKSYLLPLAQKADLQNALDRYGSVRLEKGDYSGVDIVMRSKQRLYGHPTLTRVSNITIAAGSSDVRLEQLFLADKTITFQPGGIISGCYIKTIKWTTLVALNATLEDNTFVNIMGKLNFNCSTSGYFRNNKIIKLQSGTWSNLIIMKGNAKTPSYGNVHLWTNILTPHGNSTDIDGLQTATFIGIDAEGWNLTGDGDRALIFAKNMGDVKITDFGGANGYSKVQTPTFDIDANNLFFLNKYIQGQGSSGKPKVSAKTNVILVESRHDDYTRIPGSTPGFDLKAHLKVANLDEEITYDGTRQTSPMANATVSKNLSHTILGTQYTPWIRPTWETLPDPLGPGWKTARLKKPDQTQFIQNLINTNRVAELPEGIFHIGSTLKLPVDQQHGIVGAGSGKTVIVGMTDDFPLISLTGGQDANFTLAHLTLQGGSVGVYSSQDFGRQHMAFQTMKFVIFRDQTYGMQLKQMIGFDNNFFDHVSFVNCRKGFFQDPFLPWDNNSDKSSFVDKTVFYHGQYLNCDTAVSMLATRADNLNAWVDCRFDGNNLALEVSGNNFPIVANSDFTNNRGAYTVWGGMSLYGCNFSRNTPSKATFMSNGTLIEGCDFLDKAPMFPSEIHHLAHFFILNSTVTGPVTRNFGVTTAVYVNSNLLANPERSRLLVNENAGVLSIILNAAPNPYPQLLVSIPADKLIDAKSPKRQ